VKIAKAGCATNSPARAEFARHSLFLISHSNLPILPVLSLIPDLQDTTTRCIIHNAFRHSIFSRYRGYNSRVALIPRQYCGEHHCEVQQLPGLREEIEGTQPFSGNNVSGVTSSLTYNITPQIPKLSRPHSRFTCFFTMPSFQNTCHDQNTTCVDSIPRISCLAILT
jgi:hypothetical protein